MKPHELPRLALSVRQPWAWALFNGKHIENRSQGALKHMHARMKPPGPLAIHASSGMTRAEYEHARELIMRMVGHCPRPDELVRGAILGAVEYAYVVTQSTSPWFFGPRGLVFERPTLLEQPIPRQGELGFYEWRAERCGVVVRDWGRERRPAEIEEPKPWMKAWRGVEPGAVLTAPSYIKGEAPAPLFDTEPE